MLSERRRSLIEVNNKEITIERQCELLGVARSSYYYKPKGETEYNIELMNVIDEEYTKTPQYGVRKMTIILRRKGGAFPFSWSQKVLLKN